MEQRFFGGQSSASSNSEGVLNNYGRRLLVGSSVSRAVQVSHVLQASGSESPVATPNLGFTPPPIRVIDVGPPNPGSNSKNGVQQLDPNVVIIMVVLLFALICAAFINSLMRFLMRRRAREQNAQAVFLRRGADDNSSEHGLDAKTLASLPVLTFKVGETCKPTDVDCTICLSEFTEDDRLRLLPKCNHVFHLDCIDMWLLSHVSCPVCRDPIEDGGAPVPDLGQPAEPGGAIFLTRDHQGNASARMSTGSEIVGVIGKGETLDVRAELMRDTSWNSLSEARFTSSRRLSGSRRLGSGRRLSREGSMDHRLGSSRHSFRAQIAAILASDKTSSGRWHASSSTVTATAPSARPSAEGSGLAAQDQLRAPATSPSDQMIEMN